MPDSKSNPDSQPDLSPDLSPDSKPFLTVERVAAKLDVHSNTVKRLIRMRELRAYRVGRQLRIDPVDLDVFLRERVLEPAQTPKAPAQARVIGQKRQHLGVQDPGESPEGAILSPDFTWE